jgi:uncharacterized LabA/DUF88 family protein
MDVDSDAASRTALFIDGPNFHSTARALGFDVDYRRLLAEFDRRCRLVRALYYTTISDDQQYSSVRPLVDWLDYNGYTVVTKPAKEYVDASGRRKAKNGMNIEITVGALLLSEHLDEVVLFSGDGDFRPLVEAIQRRGVRVSVVSTLSSTPPMIADELRRQADLFVDLLDLKPFIERSTPSTPPRACP